MQKGPYYKNQTRRNVASRFQKIRNIDIVLEIKADISEFNSVKDAVCTKLTQGQSSVPNSGATLCLIELRIICIQANIFKTLTMQRADAT